MNSEIVAEAACAALDGSIPFPEVVRRLVETGVEYYHVDYVALRTCFYSAMGEVVTTPIPYEGLPSVAADFDAIGLRASILDSQRHGQPYRDFTGVRWRPACKATSHSLATSGLLAGDAVVTSIQSGFRARGRPNPNDRNA